MKSISRITSLSLLWASALFGCRSVDPPNAPGVQTEWQKRISPKPAPVENATQGQISLDSSIVFDPIKATLQTKTKVPIRLPTYLATENESHPIYAIIESASARSYEIQLAFTQDCSRGNVCHFGIVSGRDIGVNEDQPKGETVSLANGLTGYFVDATCGAVCSDSTLTWDEGGFRYTVGLKAEKLHTLKKVAESATAK
jgi:hypothetical protein